MVICKEGIQSHEKPLEVDGNKYRYSIVEETITDESGESRVQYTYNEVAFSDDVDVAARDSIVAKKAKEFAAKKKEEVLGRLTVITASGKTFYADAGSRTDIGDAIQVSVDTGTTSTLWKLAAEYNGSRVVEVTVDELREAQKLALETKGQIVGALNV